MHNSVRIQSSTFQVSAIFKVYFMFSLFSYIELIFYNKEVYLETL